MDAKTYLFKKQLEIDNIRNEINRHISNMIIETGFLSSKKKESKDRLQVLVNELEEQKIKLDTCFQHILDFENQVIKEKKKEVYGKALDRAIRDD